jgi:hypothetical protein
LYEVHACATLISTELLPVPNILRCPSDLGKEHEVGAGCKGREPKKHYVFTDAQVTKLSTDRFLARVAQHESSVKGIHSSVTDHCDYQSRIRFQSKAEQSRAAQC